MKVNLDYLVEQCYFLTYETSFQNTADVQNNKTTHENFLKARSQTILPNVIWYGPLNSVQAYLVINSTLLTNEPLKAVEVCF